MLIKNEKKKAYVVVLVNKTEILLQLLEINFSFPANSQNQATKEKKIYFK